MKKTAVIILAFLMLAAASACKCNGSSGSTPTAAPASAASQTDTPAQSTADPAQTGTEVEPAVPGTLYTFTEGGEAPIISGISLSGNRCGNEINAKAPAAQNIRCIFEQNEWIEVELETSASEGIKLFVLKHNPDYSVYKNASFSEDMAGFVQSIELNAPTNVEENRYWGSFYLHPEETEAAEYDFVFTVNGKAAATMSAKFYKESELEGKTDEQLEAIMTELKANTARP